MTIAEPSTLLSDYALAGVSAWLAWKLAAQREASAALSWWVVTFSGLAVAAALGGTYHGFAPQLSEFARSLLWKLTLLAAGSASFGMLAGAIAVAVQGALRRVLFAAAAIKGLAFAAGVLRFDAFAIVIADTGISFAAVAALHGWLAFRLREPGSRWILAGVGVSLVAAGVQASGVALHRHLNHNDAYHLIQIAAMFLFFRGLCALRDSRGAVETLALDVERR
jgi:hypothetical protein